MIKRIFPEFREELEKSVSIAIIAAFSFLIALSWRDLITTSMKKLFSYSIFQGQLASTAIITLVSVLGIFLTTKFFSKHKNEKI